MSSVVVVNPGSGPAPTSVDELRHVFSGAEVRESTGDDLQERVREAVRDGAAHVVVVGGDGTMRGAAQVLAGGDVPLVPVPAGTRNHFAKDLGIDSVEAAEAASRTGERIRIDTGWVNGLVFVNNSSIGLYPKVVTRREAHQRRLPKGAAHIVAIWEQVRHGRRMTVTVGDETYRAWLVFVGNGEYGEGLLDLADRETLTDGLLDVRIVRADEPMARLRVVAALFLGRLARSPIVVRRRVEAITIDVRRHHRVEVAVDGEVAAVTAPLEYRCHPASLPVLVPARSAD